MRTKSYAYWWCQIGGWLLYSITMVFFAFLFEQEYTHIFYSRLIISIATGFLFTHLMRELFIRLDLRPPTQKHKWIPLILIILGICILYNLTNSALVELFRLYNPAKKVSVQKRFLGNLIFDSPLIFIWSSIYFLWHYVVLGRKTEIQKVKLETLVKELELKTIKSHINPHFIFNALNSIRALVDENPSRARTAITELSNILRSSMQAEKLELASLEKELSIVKDYLALEFIRFEDRLGIEYDINEDTLDQPIPPMMLQTLVENAIKHGISKHKKGGVVRIISDFRNHCHELIVQNTGQLDNDMLESSDGFGLDSTKNRLKLLYNGKASFRIHNIDGGMVEAIVSMPIIEK
ncbi:MAG: histidine kinase [Bacteroidetes bacterium]|nr:histidine kinase [Bacteroidota bacterium]